MTITPVIVLDTNVCLDLFVFRDPRWNALLAAMRAGQLRAVTSTSCRTEWQIVLTYPHLPLNDETRTQSAAEFDALITVIANVEPDPQAIRLPVCVDPDDQKFLELARDARATCLISKDKALLKLARKTAKLGLFAILSPENWVKEHVERTTHAEHANAAMQLK